MKTTCKFLCTPLIKCLYISSSVSTPFTSFSICSLAVFNKDIYSSPSNKPGTSPEANNAFILSRKAGPNTLLSSKMKQIFSPLHPALFIILLKSASKSPTP